jgi:hypothetical protein
MAKGYNCIFAIKATRAAKNGPQQNHKFIKAPELKPAHRPASVVALSQEPWRKEEKT